MPEISFLAKKVGVSGKDLNHDVSDKTVQGTQAYKAEQKPEDAVQSWEEKNVGWKIITESVVLGRNRF